jgi:hypothetical protein
MDLVAVFVLGLGLGLALGYWLAMPRVKRLEKESVLALGWQLESRLAQELSLQRLQREQRRHELDQPAQE